MVGLEAEQRDRGRPVLGGDGDEVVGGPGLLRQPCGPELAVTPSLPARGAQHLDLAGIEVAVGAGALDGCGHGRERLAEGGGELDTRRDRLDHPQLRAVEMCDHRHVRVVPVCGVELRREVVQVQHVGAISTRGAQWRFPHRGEMLGELGWHRGEHDVRHTGAVLVGGVHRRRRCDRVAAGFEPPERVGRVEYVNVETIEERRGVGLLPATPSDPTASETDQPARANAGLR